MIPSSGNQLDYPKIGDIYARFATLATLVPNLGGLLLFHGPLDSMGIATVMAANVFGAASLGIEADASVAKLALRAGVCDFVVNSLDEALRVLKNEVRRQREVSVLVAGEVDATIEEIIARGVEPDILDVSVPALIERGARMLPPIAANTFAETLPVAWGVQREQVRWLPLLDRLAVKILGEEGATQSWRIRWLEVSPRYLGRAYAAQRYVGMTATEANRFFAAVATAVQAGEIQVPVWAERNGEALLIEP